MSKFEYNIADEIKQRQFEKEIIDSEKLALKAECNFAIFRAETTGLYFGIPAHFINPKIHDVVYVVIYNLIKKPIRKYAKRK